LSALADRIKIARNASGDDINLSIQYILNCGSEVAGSCNGGSASGTYEFIKQSVYGAPYDTCQSYLACSSKSKNGFCPYINTSCAPVNICRTCDAFLARFNAHCDPIASFPNVSISEYGTIALNVSAIQAEIFARGPVTAEIHGKALHDYHGGIYSNVTAPTDPTHIVSIVGWGVSPQPHWIVRNSWGEYWGELGWFRILMGQNVLGIENKIAWATPGYYVETACAKDCDRRYVDPSQNIPALKERLRTYRNGAAIQ
jgi:cathepsin X